MRALQALSLRHRRLSVAALVAGAERLPPWAFGSAHVHRTTCVCVRLRARFTSTASTLSKQNGAMCHCRVMKVIRGWVARPSPGVQSLMYGRHLSEGYGRGMRHYSNRPATALQTEAWAAGWRSKLCVKGSNRGVPSSSSSVDRLVRHGGNVSAMRPIPATRSRSGYLQQARPLRGTVRAACPCPTERHESLPESFEEEGWAAAANAAAEDLRWARGSPCMTPAGLTFCGTCQRAVRATDVDSHETRRRRRLRDAGSRLGIDQPPSTSGSADEEEFRAAPWLPA